MYVCEIDFELPDADNPKYSMMENDIYAWIPVDKQVKVPNHRLSIRKNLKTKKFELYRYFYHPVQIEMPNAIIITSVDGHDEEVILKSKSLKKILVKANDEWNRFHSGWANTERDRDEVCKHKPPECSIMCQRRYREKWLKKKKSS